MRVLWTKAPLVLRHHPAVVVAVVAVAALAGLAAAAGPFVRAGVESESLAAQLRSMTPLATGFVVQTGGPRRQDAARRAAFLRLARGLPASGRPVLATSAYAGVVDPLGSFTVNLMTRTDAVAHVAHVTRGDGPGAWISTGTAAALHARPGDRLRIGVQTGRLPLPVTRLRVAGIYRALDGDLSNPYWQNFVHQIRAIDPNDPVPPAFVLVDRATFARLTHGTAVPVANVFELPVDPQGITLASARSLERRYAQLRQRMRSDRLLCPAGCATSSSLSSALLVASADVAAVGPTLSLLSGFGIAVALAASAAAGAFLVRRRSDEAELLHARGEWVGTFAARTALEALLPALAGAAAGVGLALLALRAFAPAGTIDGGTIDAGVGRAALVAAGALAAFCLGAAAAFPRRPAQRPRLRTLRRLPWEPLPLAVAGAFLGDLLAGGGLVHAASGETHPRLGVFVAPVLAAVGVAGLAVRGTRVWLRRRGGRLPPAPFLAVRRLAAARALLVLVVVGAAGALAAFATAATLAASLDRSAGVKAAVANGGDVQGVVDPQVRIYTPFSFPAVVVQVDSLDVRLPDGTPVDLLAADPGALARSIAWDASWGDDPRPALARLDAPWDGTLRAVATAGTPRLDAIVDQGRRLPVRVVAHVAAFPATTPGRPALVVSAAALHAAAAHAGIDDPGPGATGLVWARGDPDRIVPILRRSSLAPVYLTSSDHLRKAPAVVAATRTYGFFRTIGAAAAALALVALLLYLQARQKGQLIASALARRMGLGAVADGSALAFEAGAVVLGAGVVASAVGVALALPLVRHVDPLPQYSPASVLVVPWTELVLAVAAATLVAALAGATAAVLAARADVGEALRVA